MTRTDNLVERGSTFRKMLRIFILFAVWLCRVEAYPSGAPETACSTLTPVHPGFKAQSTASPYEISVHESGNKVTVNIISSSGEDMQGFVLQARSSKDKHKIIDGKFSHQDGISRAIDCFEGKENTLTHTDPKPKQKIETEWIPSVNLDEDVIFRASVAKNYSTFWTQVDSAPIRITSRQSASPTSQSPQEDSSTVYNTCYTSKGCFGLPEGCVDSRDCDILLFYEPTGTGVSLTLKGLLQTNEYMAMAFSKDNKMGDDFVTACTPMRAQESYNEGRTNTSRQTRYHISYRNGLASCSWTTSYLAEAPNGAIFDLRLNKYYLLLAKGPFDERKEILQYHTSKVASARSVNFTAFEPPSTQDFSDPIKGVSEEDSFSRVTEEHSASISTTESSSKNGGSYLTMNILFMIVIPSLAFV